MADESRIEKIYKKFNEIKKDSEVDCTFDRVSMNTAFNIASSLSKWIVMKSEWTKLYRELEIKRKKAYRDLYEFYRNEYPTKLNTKDEYTLFIESDINYVEHLNITSIVKEVIQFIDATIDTLKTKSFDVKNFIQWNQFINGH